MNRWAGPFTISIAGLVMLGANWGKWPDVLVDFGRELYVPWQLTAGKTLYTDLAYFNGPLSPYVNALWFRLFGVSLRTLVIGNLVIVVCITWLLYRMLSEMSDRFSATIACLVFVTVFAFGQLVGIGNYNFLCPYSHELTHGLGLSLIAMGCLCAYHRKRRLGFLAGAGVAVGLVFLTKAEVLLAAALAMMVGIGVTVWQERPTCRRLSALLGVVIGSLAVPPALAFTLLCFAMPADQAFRGTVGTWWHVIHDSVFTLPFYCLWMGTLDAGASLKAMLAWTGWYAAVFGPIAVISLALRQSGTRRIWVSVALLGMLGSLLIRHVQAIQWENVFRPLPIVLLIVGVTLGMKCVRRRDRDRDDPHLMVRLTMVTFAFVLLGKMFLYARVFNTGFGLAMPATLILVIALVGWAPSFLTSVGGYGGFFRAAGLLVVLVAMVAHLRMTGFWMSQKTHPVSERGDAFLADARGLFVNAVLQEVAQRVGVHETIAVLPGGVMLNYLARRANPTPYFEFDPLPLTAFNEARILASFQLHPPDYVILTHFDAWESGVRFFGRDFGQQLYSWIQGHYREVKLIGAPPLQDERFGILLMQRIAADEPR